MALPVTLFIQKEGLNDITVSATGNDLLKFDEKSIKITNTGKGEKTAELSFTTGEKTGVAKIRVTGTAGGETAVYDMEIEVRSPNPPETRATIKAIGPGEKWETAFNSPGSDGSGTASLEVSPLPSINLDKRLEYLLSYPHGCTEQIIPAAFPQIWLGDMSGNNDKIRYSASSNITEAIGKIAGRQMAAGGVALWPGSAQPDNWITSYAGHFIFEAERKGFSIPSSFRQKWFSYQRKTAQEWKFDPQFKQSANDQAYRLFTLALAGQPEKGAMNRLRESSAIPALSRWLLAAAYATTGRPEVAGDLLDVRKTDTEQEYSDYYYGSEVRDKSIILYTLALLKNRESALPLVKEICDKLGSDDWYSTQSTAWGLFSYMKWASVAGGGNAGQSKINISLNGSVSSQVTGPEKPWRNDLKIKAGNNSLLVENSSDKPVYATLTLKGIPVISDIIREERGMIMKIDYLDRKLSPLDPKNLRQGTDFIMVMRVTNTTFTTVGNVALTAMIPSGWEIQNTRLFNADYGIKESSFDYRDFRDDRVNTYFSLGRGETKTFTLLLSAAYKGEFFRPPVWCEAMYTGNFWSRYPGTPVTVTGQ